MSASICPEATERGWASNAREAGVPSGGSLGRNLRSKTRWFTGFCNSHHVSHFATFFIDARAEISVAESHTFFRRPRQPAPPRSGSPVPRLFLVFLGVIPRRIPASDRRARRARGKRPAGAEEAASASRAAFCHACNGRVFREATAMILPQKGQQISPRDDFATRDRVELHRQPITRIPTTTHSVTGGIVKRQPHVRRPASVFYRGVSTLRRPAQTRLCGASPRLAAPLNLVSAGRPTLRRPAQPYFARGVSTLRRPAQTRLCGASPRLDAPLNPILRGASPRLDAPLHRVSPRFARGVTTLRRPASVFCRGVSTHRRPAQTRLCGASPRLDAPLNRVSAGRPTLRRPAQPYFARGVSTLRRPAQTRVFKPPWSVFGVCSGHFSAALVIFQPLGPCFGSVQLIYKPLWSFFSRSVRLFRVSAALVRVSGLFGSFLSRLGPCFGSVRVVFKPPRSVFFPRLVRALPPLFGPCTPLGMYIRAMYTTGVYMRGAPLPKFSYP
ncbi:hypothetical protein FCM35_KLT06437 [Carex littledalei]|uniref:Uncharacterized protein n=1 Tax=Carex littledalei TaxID=544730 RepID=A0A833R0Q0_9POAL|nr:hypothetical protein FCM35_KLT06437 [Carex littledalei]